jgi:methionine--tRNA ligase beta chain
MDLRIGTIKSAEPVEKSSKLLKLQVDIGTETRQVVAGIAQHYEPASLVEKQVVVIVNLKPATLMGQLSQGMLLAAKDGKKLVLIQPQTPAAPGSKVA